MTITPPSSLSYDISGDGYTAILLQDEEGYVGYWSFDRWEQKDAGAFSPDHVGNPGWKLISYGDFTGDGQVDLVFQFTDGTIGVWAMEGATSTGSHFLTPFTSSGPDWHLVAVRDVDGDGKSDLIFQHIDGWLGVWFMDGLKVLRAQELSPNNPGDRGWRVFGAGDFYGDGKWELAFQHDDGSMAIWQMDGLNLIAPHYLNPQRADAGWRAVGVADLDRDGKSDILMEYTPDHSLGAWFMYQTIASPRALVPGNTWRAAVPGGSWRLVGPR